MLKVIVGSFEHMKNCPFGNVLDQIIDTVGPGRFSTVMPSDDHQHSNFRNGAEF